MLSVYIHIPFCVRKCSYCGFFSTRYDSAVADSFLSALEREIKNNTGILREGRIESLYIGGGTPTTLSSGQLSRLFDLVEAHIPLTADAEVTVEANPNTVSPGTLELLRERVVTRLSLGVQSFSDEVLVSLGRAHTAGQAVAAVHAARAAGFKNISIDLIYGIPRQTHRQWQQTLETALSLEPDHCSAYGLSFDEGSHFSREALNGRVALPDDETVTRMYAVAVERLAGAGYRQYEISNFCVPGRECRHNSNYWDRGQYLGLGPGAWSFIGERRSSNRANVGEYISHIVNGLPVVDTLEVLSHDQAVSETLFLGLRRTIGIDLDRFGQLAGATAREALRKRIRELDGSGLFELTDRRLTLTERGFLLSNEALARILP